MCRNPLYARCDEFKEPEIIASVPLLPRKFKARSRFTSGLAARGMCESPVKS